MNPAKRKQSRHARSLVGLLALTLSLAGMRPACADPWIPAEGHGIFDPMLRYYSADQAFSPTNFGSSTHPSSRQRETQLRFTGSQGIGNRLSIEYDLRGAVLHDTRHHITNSATGLQDQEIGLNYGLRQTQSFADSVSLNVVVPTGSATQVPALSTGKAAIEPDYQVGIARGAWDATLLAGPRIFVDGGAVQLRSEVTLGVRVAPRLRLVGTMFLVRTVHRQQVVAVADSGEIYNLFRVGAKLEYRPQGRFSQWRPFIGYENFVAGKGLHAGQRIVIGCALHY